MLWVRLVPIPKQESVSLVTNKTTALVVILELGLVLEGILMTPTRVETWLNTDQTMEKNTSKPWDIFWYNDKENNKASTKRP